MAAPYNERDNRIIANNVFIQLCLLDQADRENNREPQWQNIVQLADKVRAYENRIEVAYLAETNLLDLRGFIERDPHNQNVRLTMLGRQNCNRGIDISPSEFLSE